MRNQKNPVIRYHRKKLWMAFMVLFIATIMVIGSTFAWLTMSTNPEVVGVTTNVGANGSLEIALLNTTTRNDLSQITTRMGTSIDNAGALASNITWGNLVDLSNTAYGLDQIKLMPSQLLIDVSSTSASGYNVNPNGPLGMPKYGTDGRAISLDTNAYSAIYSGGKFALTAEQTYGVRGLGTLQSGVSGGVVGLAKSYIASYQGSAKTNAINAINNNGTGMMSILLTHSASESSTFNDANVDVLKTAITDLSTSFTYIETALRYGIIASVAQADPSADMSTLANTIRNSENDISAIYEQYADKCPAAMGDWITALKDGQNKLNSAYSACAALTGGTYTWEQLSPILSTIINTAGVYVDEVPFSEVDASALLASAGFTMTLMPTSGVFADIAAFTGDYSTWLSIMGKSVEFVSRTDANPAFLTALSNSIVISDEQAASTENMEIDNLGGYAIDLAFRCNAEDSDLQLQTAASQRVYSDSTSTDLQGGGSYMQFANKSGELNTGDMILLMDAIRITFVDVNGDILAMAKLNMSNRSIEQDGSIKAPLYLYNYTLNVVDGINVVKIGERRSGDVKITDLTRNVAKAVTAIVWIDGNLVDNTMVSATSDTSLNGILNLQFSSSADLVPAANGILYNSNASREDLSNLLDDKIEGYAVAGIYSLGQQGACDYYYVYDANTGAYITQDSNELVKWNFTNTSWNAFEAAYINAGTVLGNPGSSQNQVKSAYNELRKAYDGLTAVSKDTLSSLIDEVREAAGTTAELAGYANNGTIITEYTEELKDASTPVYTISSEKNLHDEGNGVQTPIYTEEIWNKLAIALYDAEAIKAYADASDGQVSAAITELELAYTMLERAVFYEAYELNGSIYYKAISDEADTYGKWYDEDFNRVISDLKILDLDTSATKAKVAVIEADEYYEIGSGNGISATIDLNKNAYPKFKNDEVIGIRWSFSGTTYDIDINGDVKYTAIPVLTSLISEANSIKDNEAITNKEALEGYITDAQAVIGGTSNKTAGEITQLTTDFAGAVETAKAEIAAVTPIADPEPAEPRVNVNADERTVLAAAILEAKRISGEEGIDLTINTEAPENAEYEHLGFVEAVKEAETVQAKELDATIEENTAALEALNAIISAYGGTAKTAYNTLVYTVVHSPEYAEGINRVVLPTEVLNPETNDYGTGFITARILTKNGVVYTASTSVFFYNRAEKIDIVEAGSDTYTYGVTPKAVGEDESAVELVCNEVPKTYAWSINDIAHYELTNTSTATCKVTPKEGAAGATLTLTVTMNTGSTYTATFPIN